MCFQGGPRARDGDNLQVAAEDQYGLLTDAAGDRQQAVDQPLSLEVGHSQERALARETGRAKARVAREIHRNTGARETAHHSERSEHAANHDHWDHWVPMAFPSPTWTDPQSDRSDHGLTGTNGPGELLLSGIPDDTTLANIQSLRMMSTE